MIDQLPATPQSVLAFLRSHNARHGSMPNVGEICRGLAASGASVEDCLEVLEHRRLIVRAQPHGFKHREAKVRYPRRLRIEHLAFITGIDVWDLRERALREDWLLYVYGGRASYPLAGLPADISAKVFAYYRERAAAQ